MQNQANPETKQADPPSQMNVKLKSSKNAQVNVYHTEDCKNVQAMNSVIETTKEQAEARGLRECQECAGENYHEGVDKDFSIYYAALEAGTSDD